MQDIHIGHGKHQGMNKVKENSGLLEIYTEKDISRKSILIYE
jgi:hypothetical protein